MEGGCGVAVGRPLHRGDNARRGLFLDTGQEPASDDAVMAKLVAYGEETRLVEESQSGRGARSARRPVDLPVGEHGHVAVV